MTNIYRPGTVIAATGSDKQLQFNDGGSRAGAANLTWDKTTIGFS